MSKNQDLKHKYLLGDYTVNIYIQHQVQRQSPLNGNTGWEVFPGI